MFPIPKLLRPENGGHKDDSTASIYIPLALLALAVVLDFYLPLSIGTDFAYIPFISYAFFQRPRYLAFLYAFIASAFTGLIFINSPDLSGVSSTVLLNRGLSVAALWVLALLIFIIKKQQLNALLEQEKFSQAMKNSPIGIALVATDGSWLTVNDALCDIVGYSRQELTKITFQDITHPDDLDKDLDNLKQLYKGEIKSYAMEKRYIHKNGHEVFILLTVGAVRDDDGTPLYYVSQILDITIQQLAAQQLRDARSFQDLVINTIPDLIFVKDKDHRIIQANEAFAELYPDESLSKIIGTTTLEDYREDECDEFLKNDKIAFEEGYHQTIEKIDFPDGSTRTLFTTKIRFYDYKGAPYIIGIARDISEMEQARHALEKANKELEKFAYIASHDLKAPLRGIQNLTSWIEEDLQDVMNDETKEHLYLMKTRVCRLENMLEDILQYSRANRITEKPKEIDLNAFLNELVNSHGLPDNFTINIQPEMPVIESVTTPLTQIFSNLINNAIKHHDKSEGTVSIRCEDTGAFLLFRIQDDGPGIPAEFHDRVFDMFQTLKPRDQIEGTGLGMSITRKLVEWQNGQIWIESRAGERGTAICFTWPKKFIEHADNNNNNNNDKDDKEIYDQGHGSRAYG